MWRGQRTSEALLFAAYGWLLLSGLLHFGIDVLSHAIQGRPPFGAGSKAYYGLHSAYAFSQILFAALALLMMRQGLVTSSTWPVSALSLLAACGWMTFCFYFVEYPQPRWTVLLFAVLLLGACFTR